TIDEWNLANAKKEAIEELKAAGITGQIYFDQINKAKTVEGVEALKAEILKAHAAKPGKEDPKDPAKPGKTDPAKPGKTDPAKPGKTDPA
ncbi:albumin-binding GA domain-containing protein, partial [Pseudomonas aeruginosa]|uniref:albumin-binding GA domain-containing protein n=1 Tax=Pseudomonas aeruginosa TaxID=287 RepID=UPI0034574946